MAMNWTGGRLQRSRRAGNNLTAKQKAYFANAHTRLRNAYVTEWPQKGVALVHARRNQDDNGLPQPDYGQRRLDEFENVAPLVRRLHGMKDRKTPQLSRTEDRKEDDAQHYNAMGHAVSSDHQRGYSARRGETSPIEDLKTQRKHLLRRRDWLGLAPLKPPEIKFPSQQDRKLVGRRRQLRRRELSGLDRDHKRVEPNLVQEKFQKDDAARQIPRIEHRDDISVRIGSGIHGSQRTTQPALLPTGVQLGIPTKTGIKWGLSDDMLDDVQQSSSSMLLDGLQQTSGSMLDEDLYEHGDDCGELLVDGFAEQVYEQHAETNPTHNDYDGHAEKTTGKGRDVDQQVAHHQGFVYQDSDSKKSKVRWTKEFRYLPPSESPGPVLKTSGPYIPSGRPVFHDLPQPIVENSTTASVCRYRPWHRNVDVQLSKHSEPENSTEEAEVWRKPANTASPMRDSKAALPLTNLKFDGRCPTQSHKAGVPGDDEEDLAPGLRYTYKTLEARNKGKVNDNHDFSKGLDQELNALAHCKLYETRFAPERTAGIVHWSDSKPFGQNATQTVAEEPAAHTGEYAVLDEENEAWFRFVFAAELEQYLELPESTRLEASSDAFMPFVHSLHEQSHSEQKAATQQGDNLSTAVQATTQASTSAAHEAQTPRKVQPSRNRLAPPPVSIFRRSIPDDFSNRAVASSSAPLQSSPNHRKLWPPRPTEIDKASMQVVASSCDRFAKTRSPQSIVFSRPAPFEGRCVSGRSNVVYLGRPRRSKEPSRKRKGRARIGSNMELEAGGGDDVCTVPMSSEVDDIED
jgi:hypothetical protein